MMTETYLDKTCHVTIALFLAVTTNRLKKFSLLPEARDKRHLPQG